MSYYTCADCEYMDLTDKNSWGKAYCGDKREYYSPSDRVCSDFKKKTSSSGGCYLTTIICEILNYDDDCNILTRLRTFREEKLRTTAEGIQILKEYDIIGPELSNKLLVNPNKVEVASYLLENFIKPVLQYIDELQYEKAVKTYKAMVKFICENY